MNREAKSLFLAIVLITLLVSTISFNRSSEMPEARMLIEPIVIDEQGVACILEINSDGTFIATIANEYGYSNTLNSEEYFESVIAQKSRRLTKNE